MPPAVVEWATGAGTALRFEHEFRLRRMGQGSTEVPENHSIVVPVSSAHLARKASCRVGSLTAGCVFALVRW